MKTRELIIRISGVLIIALVIFVLLLALAYYERPIYTYYVNGKFGKSNDCYITKNDFRVCNVKGHEKVVDMFYEVED